MDDKIVIDDAKIKQRHMKVLDEIHAIYEREGLAGAAIIVSKGSDGAHISGKTILEDDILPVSTTEGDRSFLQLDIDNYNGDVKAYLQALVNTQGIFAGMADGARALHEEAKNIVDDITNHLTGIERAMRESQEAQEQDNNSIN